MKAGELPRSPYECQLARFSDRDCDGPLVRAHLIPRQVLLRELPPEESAAAIQDPRSYVMACGGATGVGGHHGELDFGGVRRIRIPRKLLPKNLDQFAREHRLEWWLDARYGPRK